MLLASAPRSSRAAGSTSTPTPGNCTFACNNTTITVDCWNAGGCTVCGNTAYSCISVAPDCCAFNDPCPSGQLVQQITANVFGLDCSGGTSFTTGVNGTTIGSSVGAGLGCACSTCETYTQTSGCFPAGWPGWVSGGSNNFCFTAIGGTYCISYVQLTICCFLPMSPTRTITCPPTTSRTCTPWSTNTISATRTRTPTETFTVTQSHTITNTFPATPVLGCGLPCNSTTLTVDCWNLSGCDICGVGQLYDCPAVQSCCAFNDPCAPGLIVQQVAVTIYGTACTSPNTCFSTSLNGIAVGTTGSTPYSCACFSCTSWVHTSSCYTAGWPGYVYGGVNNLCYVPCGADQLCLAHMEITICCVLPQSPTRTITCPPTLSRTCTPWNTNTISQTFTRSPTFTRTPTITQTYSPTPIVCTPCAINCVTNGGFENGNLAGWTFTASCALGNGPSIDPCASAVGPASVQGCSDPGSCCSGWVACCPGLFTTVACGSYAAMVFSGEPPTCPGPSWGQIAQTFTIPAGGAILTFLYAYMPDNICGATADYSVQIGGGGCGNATVFNVTLSACTAWQQATVNLCSYGNCTATIRVRSHSPSTPCGFAYLDQVCCQPCTVGTPSPTATRTATRTVTWTATVTATASRTATVTSTVTVSPTATVSPSATATRTATVTATVTASATVTRTATVTPTVTPSATVTSTATVTVTRTVTSTSTVTVTPSVTATRTSSATVSRTATVTVSSTVTPTRTITVTVTDTVCPTSTATVTVSRTVTETRTSTGTATVTVCPTASATRTSTVTVTGTATVTVCPTASATRTVSATGTSTGTVTVTRTITVTGTDTVCRTPTRTATATETFVLTPTWTSTQTVTQTATESATPTITGTVTETVCPTRTASVTSTRTATATRTPSATATGTATASETPGDTETATSTATATRTSSATWTASRTATASATDPNTATPTATRTDSATPSETRTVTETRTETETATATHTRTESPTPSETRTFTDTPTATATASDTRTPTDTPAVTPTATRTPTVTRTETATSTESRTWTESRTDTPSRTSTATRTDSPTATVTRTWTESRTPTFSPTSSSTPTETWTFSPTRTATPTLSPTYTDTFSQTFTVTPTRTPSRTPTETATDTPIPPFFHVNRNQIVAGGVPATVSWRLSTGGRLQIYVFNGAGEYVQTIWDADVLASAVYATTWDGTNWKGEPVSSNVYVFRVHAPGWTRNVKIGVQR